MLLFPLLQLVPSSVFLFVTPHTSESRKSTDLESEDANSNPSLFTSLCTWTNFLT